METLNALVADAKTISSYAFENSTLRNCCTHILHCIFDTFPSN